MTQTSTDTDAQACYFCQGIATHVKREATAPVEDDDVETVELLTICESCNEENYDGTEEYPALLPL
jgi:uncharacterized protein with PIN domain